MAQIPTSSITMRAIFNEINGTNHANGTAITDCKMSEFRADSIAYTSGGGSSPNVKTTPDRMNEWAGYLHSQSMGSITYGVRIATATSSWGLNQAATHTVTNDTAYAEGAITIWRTHDGSNTYIKAKAYNEPTNGATRQYHNGSSGQTLTTASSGQTLITIPVSDVTIAATVTGLTGTTISYTPTAPAGSGTPDDISGTGAALLVCRGAESAEVDNGFDLQQGKFKVTFIASKTGYQTTNLDNSISGGGIIVHSMNDAEAESGE